MQEFSYIFFLGSHADISATELWRALEQEKYEPTLVTANQQYIRLELKSELSSSFIDRLGGTERIAKIVTSQGKIFTVPEVAKHIKIAANTKLNIGVSGLNTSQEYPRRLGLDLKRFLKESGHKVKVIIPKKRETRLNSASILFNRLTTLPHRELTVIKVGEQYLLTQTTHVQDITKYELRDTGKPGRDAKVGMLPPKLAQIMINLTATSLPPAPNHLPLKIYDPFCGTGTILQEGWLMSYKMSGGDASERMTRATKKNLDWLANKFSVDPNLRPHIFLQDARYKPKVEIDAVVSEPYLGNPAGGVLPEYEVMQRVSDLGQLYRAMLEKLHNALPEGGSVVLALPAWRRDRPPSEDWNLFPAAFLDDIESIGYSRVHLIPEELEGTFPQNERRTLLYARPDALVGRELVHWKKY